MALSIRRVYCFYVPLFLLKCSYFRGSEGSLLQRLTDRYLCGIVILMCEMRSLYNSLKVNLGSGNLLQEGKPSIV